MKRLLAYITPTTVLVTIVWTAASWMIQARLGIPSWFSLLANLFFFASACLKFPPRGTLRSLSFNEDWLLITIGTVATLGLLRWVRTALTVPWWGHYVAVVFSIIILERVLIEGKKLYRSWKDTP